MRKVLGLMVTILLSSISCLGQVSFTSESSPSISTDENASPVVVDEILVINTTHTIDGAEVSITSNFTRGDTLSFSNTSKPSGVSGNYNASTGILTFTGNASAAEYQTLLQSVTLRATARGSGNRLVTFQLGSKKYFSGTDHYYEYVSTGQISWKNAKAGAAAKSFFGLTGYLTTIATENENQFIQSIIGSDSWIGASDDYTEIKAANTQNNLFANQSAAEGKYHWVTGPESGNLISTYNNWNNGEPTPNNHDENYAHMYQSGGLAGKWNDLVDGGNSTTAGYVIEFGGLPSGITLDVTHSRTVIVQPTVLTTTASKNYHIKNSSVIVDPFIEVKSGGLITDARVTISGNFTSEDQLWHQIDRPSGINGGWYNPTTGVFEFYGTAKPSDWQALFRSITFKSTSTSSLERTITFSVGNLISGENGHFYEFIPSNIINTTSWTQARNAAASRIYMGLQGYLATITSEKENELVSKKLSADGWLGGSDDVTVVSSATLGCTSCPVAEGNFYWVTGPEKGLAITTGNVTPMPVNGAYYNWYDKEPNDAGTENYLKMYSVSGALGTWNDMPLNSTVGMVVEYGGLDTDPSGVLLSASRVLTNDQVLPVRGLELQLREKGTGVELQWTVLGEEDVKHYEVLHSINGSNFRKIGEVKATDKGNKIMYSFTDANAVNGTNYYKIVVVDEDGKLHYSDVRSIGIASKLQLYPTVITDHFTVNQPNASPSVLTLTDVSGVRLLQKTIGQGINKIETGFLTAGTYFVQITRGSNEPEVFKIIKK